MPLRLERTPCRRRARVTATPDSIRELQGACNMSLLPFARRHLVRQLLFLARLLARLGTNLMNVAPKKSLGHGCVDLLSTSPILLRMVDVGTQLGASLPQGTTQLTLFIPSVDRESRPIDQRYWCDEALRTLGTLFRGATAFPPGRGVWRNDAAGGALVYDDTVLVTSYAAVSDVENEGLVVELRRFLHRLGREAQQGEVGIIVNGTYHAIETFDAPAPEE